MPNLADEQYLSYTDEIQCNCLNNIIDQNINTDDETNTCQLIKHTSYYDVEQFKHLADTHKDEFTVLSSNIQSINAKLNELEIFTEELQNIDFKFSIICLQESWITDLSDTSQIQLAGYNCITQGKSSSEKGGLITYVDVNFSYEIILNINEYANWEGHIIKVSGGGLPKSVIICNLYRPPRMLQDQIRQFINELSTVLSTIERKTNDVLLAGDFNINLLKLNENETCSEFFDSLLAHSFLPQITVPTRFGQFSHTLIDNFFLNLIT